ncbi:MAG: glucosamine-6-phosphate deaminase [Caldilineaceae bacterium]|nr:glucosamine-6-phosphate deaminase [Caldilineaceae bacterium]
MNVQIAADGAALARNAADYVVAAVRAKPDSAIVFPTGKTPVGLYKELIARYHLGFFDPSQLRIFLLDEYVGIGPEDLRSLHGWLQRELFIQLAIRPEQVTPLDGAAADLAQACRSYEAAVYAAGGLDLAILGLGPNGHIGYNDPPAAGDAPTRVLQLSQSSLDTCARDWGPSVPLLPQAITAGMDLLLAARQKLLIVSGESKQHILYKSLLGPVTPDVPASYLQQADGVTVMVDKGATRGALAAALAGGALR